jgi:CelD/BcsL family acetyltransferase involved in cellulose biosynthesis/GNAT superfamily N-acetyltransferase
MKTSKLSSTLNGDVRPPVAVQPREIRTLESLETALAAGLLSQWLELVDTDPLASAFQAPGWCMAWYRSYSDLHEPLVLLVESDGELLGLVPLAVDRATRRLDFASGSSADYRDIVARPGARREVVKALVHAYLDGRFSGVLSVGWIDPRSDTPLLLREVSEELGVFFAARTQPCWRWKPPAPEKPSGKKFLNWYQRHSTVDFRRVLEPTEWVAFREEYYLQHSLRQLQSGRKATFDDPRRRRFYDSLFASPHLKTHVTGFFANGVMVAGHFGVVWRGEILLGPPSIRLEDETRSPAVVLLSWIIQHAEAQGLRGFDLTIGNSDFKRRLGNYCVELTAIDIYATRGAYLQQHARQRVVGAAKQITARLGGDEAWKTKVLPRAAKVQRKCNRFRELGVWSSAKRALGVVRKSVYDRRIGLLLRVRPGDLREVTPKLPAGAEWQVNTNRSEDLLKWAGKSLETSARISEIARGYGKSRASGRSMHTLLVDDRLAGWGFSYLPDQPAVLSETPGASYVFPSGSASLYDFYVLPEFRGQRLYQALLCHIVQTRFAEGVSDVYIAVLHGNVASRSAIERVGFHVVHRNHYVALLGRRSIREEKVEMP